MNSVLNRLPDLRDIHQFIRIREENQGANTQQVTLSYGISRERHDGTKRGVKQYWNVWIRSLLSKPLTLTYGDTLQPVLLRQLNDKWSCLSANICYSSAAWTGTARPAGCMVLAWQPPLKLTPYRSVTQLQPISTNQTLLSEILQPQAHPVLNVSVWLHSLLKELIAEVKSIGLNNRRQNIKHEKKKLHKIIKLKSAKL